MCVDNNNRHSPFHRIRNERWNFILMPIFCWCVPLHWNFSTHQHQRQHHTHTHTHTHILKWLTWNTMICVCWTNFKQSIRSLIPIAINRCCCGFLLVCTISFIIGIDCIGKFENEQNSKCSLWSHSLFSIVLGSETYFARAWWDKDKLSTE